MNLDIGAIGRIDTWLDEKVGPAYDGHPLAQDWARISKVTEEAGEAISAFIGVTGQNPRKGITHDMDDVLNELADVAMTAILAMQHFTKDTAETRNWLRYRIDRLAARVPNA